MDIFSLPVHPSADIFPMLDSEELADLAEDIKTNGLNHPLIIGDVDGELMLIDGRNRREACRIAGVTPETKQLNGSSAEALILSENIMRRHMTKGQRAMAVAMMYPEAKRGVHSESQNRIGKDKTLSNYLVHARVVLKYSPALAQDVIAGGVQLYEAYEEAKQALNQPKELTKAERLDALREKSPMLADQVVEGVKTIDQAENEHEENERIARANREAGHRELRDGIYGFGSFFITDDRVSTAVELITDYRTEFESICGRDRDDSLRYLKAMQKNIVKVIAALEGK